MKVFVAGATGAIGRPLIAELVRQGHAVTALAHSESSIQFLKESGVAVAVANVFDAPAVEHAVRQSQAEVVIDELTALPKSPAEMESAQPGDRKLRIEGGGNLLRAAQVCGVRRYVQQSSGFFLKSESGLADESNGMAIDASPGVAFSARSYAELESRLSSAQLDGVALRYGFFYGPNTWYSPDGACADQARRQEIPIIGRGQGVWSWVHIEDVAMATVAALTAPPGVYNIVDDDPSPVSTWLPAFAKSVGAPPPPHVTEQQARDAAGEDAVYYDTRLCGATNGKAKKTLGFKPRRLEWLSR
ncbi:MAG TPA: NAD(P)-dependent oxidoreductase [Planctomycetaceae bacterium]|jgi:nucleoside-diphosphate-sugar epimerase|nr:NAD(P)-dependent oxidoreductase [Planctomycetaceae bacterium]